MPITQTLQTITRTPEPLVHVETMLRRTGRRAVFSTKKFRTFLLIMLLVFLEFGTLAMASNHGLPASANAVRSIDTLTSEATPLHFAIDIEEWAHDLLL